MNREQNKLDAIRAKITERYDRADGILKERGIHQTYRIQAAATKAEMEALLQFIKQETGDRK